MTTLNLDENESLSVYNWLMRLMLSLQPLPHQERFVKALSCIKTRTLVPSMIQTLENLVQTRETHSHAEVLVSSLRDAFSRNAAEAISSHEFSQLLRIYVQSLDNLGLDIQLDSVIRICCSK